MKSIRQWRTRTTGLLIAVWVAAAGGQLTAGLGIDARYVNAELIFWIVVIAAGLCAVFSSVVIVRAYRADVAETAMLGAFLMSTSVLPFAHGLLIPGVLYGPNAAVMLTVQIAVPLGALAVLPLAFARQGWANRLASTWHWSIPLHLGLTAAVAVLLLFNPDLVAAAATGTAPAVAFAVMALVICVGLSIRHLRLAQISGHALPIAIAVGCAFIGSAPMIFVAGDMFGVGFWLAHALDISGVLLASGSTIFAYRRAPSLAQLFRPIDAATPLRALELGLDPLVHRFVADLDAKDRITRDHVVRTAELTVLVAEELGLSPAEIRRVGLGAILHDVGKLETPDEILNKPGRLDAAEFAVMQRHSADGDRLVRESVVLADIAPLVRSHHERIDGRGYPDGLSGSEIPLGARIVSVCDAYDAMAHTRQYRAGMEPAKVAAILREHAGAQWDTAVVDALLRTIDRRPEAITAKALESVGREFTGRESTCCDDALPADVLASI